MNPRIGFWVAVACVQVVLTAGIAGTAQAASSLEKTTINERVAKVREALSERKQQPNIDGENLACHKSCDPWDNWDNWENWDNWDNWENWENWDNWDNWENWSNY